LSVRDCNADVLSGLDWRHFLQLFVWDRTVWDSGAGADELKRIG